jgi:hypothetical protein
VKSNDRFGDATSNGRVPLYLQGAEVLPRKESFTTRNSQGLLNSTRTRGPPVRPTGETGVAVAGSATGRSTG